MSRIPRRYIAVTSLLFAALALGPGARADLPPWVAGLRQIPASNYPADADAAVLLDEGRTVVTENGEIKSYYRMAYKVLAPRGTGLAWIRLAFDSETRITDLQAWNLKADGVVHEAKMKEGVEVQASSMSGVFFEDNKTLLLFVPQVEVDSIIAYEFERRHRPYILQDFWIFQSRYPVVRSRFELELPQGWEYRHRLMNHAEVPPQQAGPNRWVWELRDLPGIPDEDGMPPLSTVVARLAVTYFPRGEGRPVQAVSVSSWNDVAKWFAGLVAPREALTPTLEEKARQLASWKAGAEFVQKQIRYVAIEIGIGGYQPHASAETLRNSYGDCKDKVTLLKSLLRAQGRQLYPVLINAHGVDLQAEFPSPLYFNHVIAAIPVGEEEPDGPAVLTHSELGRLLLFDPTDERTPVGRLPSNLQGTRALLVRGDSGAVIDVPVTAPAYNRVMRTGNLRMTPGGQAEGEISELMWGRSAARDRNVLQGQTQEQWIRDSEGYLARWLPGVVIRKFSVGALNTTDPLTQTYQISAPYLGQEAGEMILLKPALIGVEILRLTGDKDRNYPFEFSHLRLHTDQFEITLPDGYALDTLPGPLETTTPFGFYRLALTAEGNKLKVIRRFEIRMKTVDAGQIPAVKEFYRFVERAERTVVFLKRPAA